MANYDMHTSLPALAKTIPTIFIWGESDISAAPSLGRELEALLPGIKFQVPLGEDGWTPGPDRSAGDCSRDLGQSDQ
jgi:hypothetical protein